MQYINKPQLTERILSLISMSRLSPTAFNEDEIRQQLEHAIDDSMIASQRVESRRVTILLSDLRGFTAMSEKYSAVTMVETLNRYFERMSEIIVSHGGTIDKFMGDSIMALFGAPTPLRDEIESAISCAIEMQLAMGGINDQNKEYGMPPLFMGIGINTGEVVAGNLGSILHSEYTVIGDQVNLASRVEAHTLRGQILLSENTYQQAKNYIEIGDVNEVHVKGKKEAVRMYELLAMTKPQVITVPRREIRNSHRVEVDLPLLFYIIDGKTVLPQEHTGTIIDLSYGGMFVVTKTPLEPFSDIKINISLSLMGYEQTEIYAKVLRITPFAGGFKCPLEFTAIDVKAQQAIKDFVDRLVEMK